MSAVLSLPQIPVAEIKVLVSAAQTWGLPSSAQTSLIRQGSLGLASLRIPKALSPSPGLVVPPQNRKAEETQTADHPSMESQLLKQDCYLENNISFYPLLACELWAREIS